MRRDAHIKGGLCSWQMIWRKTNSRVVRVDSLDNRVDSSVRAAKRAANTGQGGQQSGQQNQQKKGGQGQNEEDENQGQRRAS